MDTLFVENQTCSVFSCLTKVKPLTGFKLVLTPVCAKTSNLNAVKEMCNEGIRGHCGLNTNFFLINLLLHLGKQTKISNKFLYLE